MALVGFAYECPPMLHTHYASVVSEKSFTFSNADSSSVRLLAGGAHTVVVGLYVRYKSQSDGGLVTAGFTWISGRFRPGLTVH